jgi:hypothetical protein
VLVMPSLPPPQIPVKITSNILRTRQAFLKYFKTIIFKILNLPVSLFSYSQSVTSIDHAHFRLCHSKIQFLDYRPLGNACPKQKLPDTIKVLYIESCEFILSQNAQSVARGIFCALSNGLSSRNIKLYLKPRLANSIFDIPSSLTYPELNHVRCEEVDMANVILVTIASSGALSKRKSKIISVVNVLSTLAQSSRDCDILNIQRNYAICFRHPSFMAPKSIENIIQEIAINVHATD